MPRFSDAGQATRAVLTTKQCLLNIPFARRLLQRASFEDKRDTVYKMSEKYEMDAAELNRAFGFFDLYGTGQVDIRFLAELLGPFPGLGFKVTPTIIRKLVKKYDDDQNQCFSRPEFEKLLKDPALRGR